MTEPTSPESNLLTVGWREWVALPEIGIKAIKAKIDTGARTSCLHTASYEVFQKDGRDWARFIAHPIKSDPSTETESEAPVTDYRVVRDSGGHEENRPFILTTVSIGGEQWPIELSLSNRENMKFRMLIGRKALAGRLLVHCEKSYLIGKRPR
ncbi:MAG: ATP-dependent zinc protease family protein [Verrucomicrobiaceae bacterium]